MTNEIIDMTDLETREKVVLVTIIYGLTIELGTGMKVSRGVQPLQALKRNYPDFRGNKRKGLQFAVDAMRLLDPEYQPSKQVLSILS